MRDHLLGYPPALLALDPEPRASRETPPRTAVSREWIAGLRLGLTPADTRGHFGADRLAEVQRAMTAPEVAPPSAPKLKAGEEAAFLCVARTVAPVRGLLGRARAVAQKRGAGRMGEFA